MISARQISTVLTLCICIGCKPEIVEYHTRPAWHYSMTNSLSSEEVREDGTIVKYMPMGGSSSNSVREYLDGIELEKVNDVTGEVTLRAILPEHVLMHTLTCLRDRDWDLLYDQILSKESKAYFGDRHAGPFEAFFEKHRRELAKSMQRMVQGKAFGDVYSVEEGNKITLTFSSRMVGNFKFKKFTFIRIDEYLQLYSIE